MTDDLVKYMKKVVADNKDSIDEFARRCEE